MTNISINSERSVFKRLGTAVGAGAIIAAIVGGIYYVREASTNWSLDSNATELKECIAQKEISTCQALFEKRVTQKGLKPIDQSEIASSLATIATQQAETKQISAITQTFESSIARWNYNGAASQLKELKEKKALRSEKMSELEDQLKSLSEPAIYGKIKTMSGPERVLLCEQYLSIYPSGTHKKEVAEKIFLSEADKLDRLVTQHAQYSELYAQTVKLRDIVTEYASELESVNAIATELTGKIRTEISKIKDIQVLDTKLLAVKDAVYPIKVELPKGNPLKEGNYLTQRNKLIGFTRSGEITVISGELVYVRFEELQKPDWYRSGWSREYASQWLDDDQKTVPYLANELLVVRPISPITTREYELELSKMDQALAHAGSNKMRTEAR